MNAGHIASQALITAATVAVIFHIGFLRELVTGMKASASQPANSLPVYF